MLPVTVSTINYLLNLSQIEMSEAGRCVAWLCYQQLATSNPSTLINLVDRVTRVLSKHLDSEIPVDCTVVFCRQRNLLSP